MLLRYFYDEKLAHASYLVGCQRTGEAIVIDPGRHPAPYLRTAEAEGLRIVAATETHIHADFVSGARELGVAHGAKLYLSDEGGDDWRYRYAEEVKCRLIKHGDRFAVGNLSFEVLHTPGHTPESISLMLTDLGGGADEPMGIFTGDFVFVGDVGRPDLLEKAAGLRGTSEAGARAMFRSLQQFKRLPDYLQVWPAHGAGSACGKSLGAVPSSTVGYEKRFNPALSYTDEEAFVQALLDGQPEPPRYFAVMKQVNRKGPELLSRLAAVAELSSVEAVTALLEAGAAVLDTRPAQEFAKGHLEGTINIPYNKSFPNWAGWLIDYERPLAVLAKPDQWPGILTALRSIGIDNVTGYMDAGKLRADGSSRLESYAEATPSEMAGKVEAGDVHLVDVRGLSEWQEGRIPGAQHLMLGTLPGRLSEIPRDKPVLLQCRSGARSAIAASVLQAGGIKEVINLSGGYIRWREEGLPHEDGSKPQAAGNR